MKGIFAIKNDGTPDRRFLFKARDKGILTLSPTVAEINALPSHQAAVVRLRCAKKRYGEIAQALGLPKGTVRSRLSRARDALARIRAGDGHSVRD